MLINNKSNDCNDYWEHYNQFRKILKNDQSNYSCINGINGINDTSDILNGFKCKKCNHLEYNTIDVCTNCGLVINNVQIYDSFYYKDDVCNENHGNDSNESYKRIKLNGKMSKMTKWISESNNEKHEYKLLLYVKNLCNKLNIQTHINYIYDITSLILKLIKEREGTKRSKVKDGIIIVCIYYTFKKHNLELKIFNQEFTLHNLAKNINIDLKYIRQAEKTILDLITKNLIDMDKNILLNVKSSDGYIQEIKDIFITLNEFSPASHNIFFKLKELIKYIEYNEIFLDITPYNIAVGCFYYILKNENGKKCTINLMCFSKSYNVSYTTIQKIYKKCIVLDIINMINKI